MTPQEAIEILEINAICSPKATKFKEAVEVAKQALEKQIPKKVIPFARTAHDFQSNICKHSGYPCEHIKPFNHEYKYTDYKCPVCSKLTKEGTPRLCWNCGQALDWSDKE